jgi:D-3-phosphoglycerate dehydrogenase|tara:strand:+ start:125 stop:1027 length:903 start_codon:yes stop_codon:yes gene_type:complete
VSKKVLLGTSSFGALDSAPIEKLKEFGFDVIPNPYKRKLTKDEVVDLLGNDVEALVAGLEPLDREVFEKTSLKVLSRCGSGMSNVDSEAAKELNIAVYNTPDGPTQAVAELTLGSLLNLLRHVSLMDQRLHQGEWSKQIGFQLKKKTVCIIGFGKIGQRFAGLLKPFDVRIIAVDPYLKENAGVEVMELKDALKISDIISLHCSGEECLIGKDEFLLIKEGAFILNAARGALVDEDALLEALDDKRVAGVWFDTFAKEPYDGKLKNYEQALLTPHVGSYTLEGRRDMEMETVNNLLSYYK